jgi:hypothetical protein
MIGNEKLPFEKMIQKLKVKRYPRYYDATIILTPYNEARAMIQVWVYETYF